MDMMDDKEEHEEIFAEENPQICKLCLKEKALYTCPRCNIRYCSSACYKGEGHLDCSENFYKECFMEGLKDYQTSPDDRKEVLDMLQRLENDNPVEEDSDTEEDLETRLAGLDLDRDTDKVWDRLTEDEKTAFREMLADGRMGHLVPIYEPWWKMKKKSMVEDVSKEVILQHPKIKGDIPELSKIFPKEPSPLLKYTVVNVLYAYAYTCRVFNGDLQNFSVQSVREILKLSKGLKQNQTFSTTSDAIHSCLASLQSSKGTQASNRGFNIGVIEDVKHIIEGPNVSFSSLYVLAALSDLLEVLKTTRKKKCKGDESLKKILFTAGKKLEFLLSWTMSHGSTLEEVITDLELEFCTLSTELASHQKKQELIETAWGGQLPPKPKKLIEELSDL